MLAGTLRVICGKWNHNSSAYRKAPHCVARVFSFKDATELDRAERDRNAERTRIHAGLDAAEAIATLQLDSLTRRTTQQIVCYPRSNDSGHRCYGWYGLPPRLAQKLLLVPVGSQQCG